MKIRMETIDGNPIRFKLYDEETEVKLGLVQSVTLTVTVDGATLQFTRIDPETLVIDEEKRTYTGTLITSPLLEGKFDGSQYVFED